MKKILVANRGEIALRVMKSAREMGIKTVAVYSEIDRTAPFVRYADEAYLLGPSPSNQSYLLGEKIVSIAKKCGAEGIHPGYGFLSENANFSSLVKSEGLIFIGPGEEAIRVMGSKLDAKKAVKSYGIPLVPGTDTPVQDIEEAKKIAAEIGFPILIKASAGGGGKGMRIVENVGEFEEQMHLAQNEARSSFGDDAVFIEKYVASPRHIEFQILADRHGNVVHLFDRECSIQRRHQKVVEEAPSSVLTAKLREEMGNCACDVARACNYEGAGTVEFILDENLNFYFLEMNTRLQVEHPVTEMITGIDLVKQQILVARGNTLDFKQDDLKINGHSLEIRVYAEDPKNNFLPDIGKLSTYQPPKGPGVRVDDGFEEGMEIPIYYDPMIAKLITHGATRNEAISRMTRAIDEYKITGIQSTLPFCKFAINHEAFVSGNFDTHFVGKYYKPDVLEETWSEVELQAAALFSGLSVNQAKDSIQKEKNKEKAQSFWKKNRL